MERPIDTTSTSSWSWDSSTRWLAVVVAVAVTLAMGPIVSNDFTWFDDPGNLHQNPLMNPPTWGTLKYYWTTPQFGLFVPVTQTFWAGLSLVSQTARPDPQGIRLNPMQFHLASLVVHAISSLAVMVVLSGLFRHRLSATLGAVVFAVHPVQVETVAWAAMFKDLLAWMWCIIACALMVSHVRHQQKRGSTESTNDATVSPTVQVGLVLLYLLAFFSKPQAMVLPAALTAIYCVGLQGSFRSALRFTGMLWLLAPLLGAFAWMVQSPGWVFDTPLWARPFIAGDSLFFYLGKVVWPVDLIVDYGRQPQKVMNTSGFWWHWLVPACILAAGWMLRRRWRWLLLGMLLFVIGPSPVLGLTRFLYQSNSTVTDHYVYFGLLGLGVIVSAVVSLSPRVMGVFVMLIAGLLGWQSHLQCKIWQDNLTLFQHAIRVNPQSALSLNNLGASYLQLGRTEEALVLFERADRVNPLDGSAGYNQAKALIHLGRFDDADRQFRLMFERFEATPPADPSIHPALAVEFLADTLPTVIGAGRLDLARDYLDKLRELFPDYPKRPKLEELYDLRQAMP